MPGNPVYNEAVTIRKEGTFDPDAFRSAFRELIRRHEIWRSTFEVRDSEPVQIVHDKPQLVLPFIDLSFLSRLKLKPRPAASPPRCWMRREAYLKAVGVGLRGVAESGAAVVDWVVRPVPAGARFVAALGFAGPGDVRVIETSLPIQSTGQACYGAWAPVAQG